MATQSGITERESLDIPPLVSDERLTLARGVSNRFRRENRHHIRGFISITVAKASSWLARALPLPIRYWIADRLGDVLYTLSPGYRKNVLSNLAHVHRFAGKPAPTLRDVRTVFRVSSRNWADLLIVPGRTEQEFRSDVRLSTESLAHIDDAIARGNGCVIVTAHLGAFDVVGHYLHAIGYKLTIVTGRTTARIVFDGVTYLRQSNGLELVEATPSGVRKAIHTVRQGNCAVIVSDRDFFQNGVDVNFFGERTTLPPGAIRIARDTGAAIVPVYGRRADVGHEITIHKPILVPKSSDLKADLAIGMERVVESMQTAISAVPDQWVMFQSVWPSEPGAGA
jgi:lauroyl/myristoyl acyltransferase